MSAQWSEGYFTDATYTFGYYQELSPVMQRYCLILKGMAPPENPHPNCCELGFGQGLSLNIHAAALPGECWGNDFNPAHVAFAENLARHAGIKPHLCDDSFERFLQRPGLPQFDYIGLHGIWSWVSPANRHHIVNFIDRYLKPGGALYISYNALPGWAPLSPMRQLLTTFDRYGDQRRDVATRVKDSIDFAEQVLNADPLYGNAVQGARAFLDGLRNQDPAYLVNEYFNASWDSMYFLNVADQLSAAKMEFAASASPAANIANLGLLDKAAELLNQISHPAMREQVRDYVINQQFRKDIFVKGARRLSGMKQRHLLMEQRFVMRSVWNEQPLELQTGMGRTTLDEKICRPLLAELAARACPVKAADLHAGIEHLGLSFEQTAAWLAALVSLGLILPCQSAEAEALAGERCAAFNREVLRRAERSGEITWLASPAAGMGVFVEKLHQAFLNALHVQDPVHYVMGVLKANNQCMVKDGKALESEAENLQAIAEQFSLFKEKLLPVLHGLGVA